MPINEILIGDCREILPTLPDGSVQCCVTSPPYWGLRDYKLGDNGIGQEATVEEHLQNIVVVFEEIRRVLRPDGTLWLNYGDRYNSAMTRGSFGDQAKEDRGYEAHGKPQPQLKMHAKNLLGLPWRVAFALQRAGWILRSDIIWHKPNPMPDSVRDRPTCSHEYLFLFSKSGNATYWTHRDIAGTRKRPDPDYRWINCKTLEEVMEAPEDNPDVTIDGKRKKLWARRNLWSGHDYYYDQDAVREANSPTVQRAAEKYAGNAAVAAAKRIGNIGAAPDRSDSNKTLKIDNNAFANPAGRNKRSVWTIATQPTPEAHFATFPEKLVEPTILAGTSERGACVECGAPWERVVESEKPPSTDNRRYAEHSAVTEKRWSGSRLQKWLDAHPAQTKGFRPTCTCNATTRPCIVLDPFMGSGTVARVAEKHGRDWIGIEMNPEYVEIAKTRTQQTSLLTRCHE